VKERFSDVVKSYPRNAYAVIVCYSIVDGKSFERIEFWLSKYDLPKDMVVVIA